MTESRELYNTVIKNDYCIGCGACVTVPNSPFEIKMDEYGKMVAYPLLDLDTSQAKVLSVCPFSGKSKNEDELSNEFFPNVVGKDSKIGSYISCYAGFVKEGDFRKKGSSGGVAKWTGYTLLKEKKIDCFIQLTANSTSNAQELLFDYKFFNNENEILEGSKSSYYPSTLSNVIKKIKEVDGRYAITGVPCFLKTLRLLALQDEILKKRIKYTIGIICGGMKSANQSKMIGWELGVKPENLIKIDFRRKYNDRPASQKIYEVWSKADSVERYKNAGEIYGTDYGSGFFKPNACDYCDDVVAETADISVGDAWLPQFVKDPNGTSIIIIRNYEIHELFQKAIISGELQLSALLPTDVSKSQEGGFRHRREALSYRLAKKELKNEWHPLKRVKANEFLVSPERKKIYDLREQIAAKSHTSFLNALKKNSLQDFHKDMNPLIKKYYIANHGKFIKRIFNKIQLKLNKYAKAFKG